MKTLLIVLLFLCSVFTVCGQKKTLENRQSEIPKGWKIIDLDSFSFFLPQSMEDKKARGIDSAVWHFEDSEMELRIDSGMYTNNFQYLKNSYEVKKEVIKIDNKNVECFIWDINKNISQTYAVNKDGSIKPHETFEKHFAIGVYFYESPHQATNFSISSKTSEKQEIAKTILQSIKFKN